MKKNLLIISFVTMLTLLPQMAMAALEFVGKASGSGTGATYSVSLTGLQGGVGSSAAAGDLVIVVTGWASTANGDPGITTPAGYTEVLDLYDSDTRDANMSVNWKTMGATPDTSVTVRGFNNAANGGATVIHVWRGAASTTPMDVTPTSALAPANKAHPDSPSITPVTTGAYVLSVGMGTGDAGPLPQTAPTGYGNATSTPGAGTTMSIIANIASFAWTSGAEDPAAWTGGDADTASDNWVAGTLAIRPAFTFLGNDTDPGANPTIAPGAATTTVGTFNLLTTGFSETVTNATTTLATGTATATVAVLITNSANTTIYCTAFNPSSDAVGLTGCNLPVTSASTTFNIRIKPLTHGSMPVPPGGTYAVTATITAITATYSTGGTDTTSDTVTIDNASPNGATATSGAAGDQKVTLNWTTSNSGDFDTTSGSVVYRWAAAAAGSETPDEGITPSVGGADGTATVACVISSAASSAQSKIDGSGGSAGCTTTALTNSQQYTYVAFQRDTNGNYDVGVSIGTFTPAGVSLTFTVDTSSVFIGAFTPGTPISSSTVLTVNTDSSTGYNITVNRASTTPTLFFNDKTVSDTPSNNNWTAPSATTTVGASAIWTDGATQGLGFRVKQTGTNSGAYHSAWWGADDASGNAKYSGISTSTAAQMICKNNVGTASNENITVNYRIDVPSNQSSGAYISSPVTYTATVNP